MRRVSFIQIPTDKEYFEEYHKYNTLYNAWFILIFILRSFAPLCLGLQMGPFENVRSVKTYINEFSLQETKFQGYFFYCSEFTNTTSTEACRMGTVILRMAMFRILGLSLGAILGGILGDVYGRHCVAFTGSVVWISAAFVLALAKNIIFIEILYIVTTACSSIVTITTFVNFSEIASRKHRILVLYTRITYILGDFAIEYIVDNLERWHYYTAFIASAMTCVIFATFYIPDSPRWLLCKNKKLEAYQQLCHISGKNYSIFDRLEIPEVASVPKRKLLWAMMKYLFDNRIKHFLLCNMLIAISSANWACSKMKTLLHYVDTEPFQQFANAAELFSYLFLLPLYIFLGKRIGLFFCYFLLAISHFFALFAYEYAGEHYYDLFNIMLGLTSLSFCWLYFLDIFPTFLRATATGVGFCVFNIAVGVNTYLVFYIQVANVQKRKLEYNAIFFALSLFGATALMLPDSSNEDVLF